MIYNDAVTEHFDRPRNCGRLDPARQGVICGTAGRVETGARVEIDLAITNARVADARFRAYGCPHLIAAASMLMEMVKGVPVDRLTELRPPMLAEPLGLPQHKLGLMLVLEDALLAAARAAQGAPDE